MKPQNKISTLLFIFSLIFIVITSVTCSKDKTTTQGSTFANQIAIPNGDFENWESTPYEGLYPVGWVTNNRVNPPISYETIKDSDAYHGVYAMKLVNADSVFRAQATIKFPINNHPVSFIGYVKCNLAPLDTISVQIKLLFNNTEVDSGFWAGTTSINNYIQIHIPITQYTSAVDSALIIIHGGNHLINNQLGHGSAFWIDYISLNPLN